MRQESHVIIRRGLIFVVIMARVGDVSGMVCGPWSG